MLKGVYHVKVFHLFTLVRTGVFFIFVLHSSLVEALSVVGELSYAFEDNVDKLDVETGGEESTEDLSTDASFWFFFDNAEPL